MNNDINNTLMALVPILRMNGERIKSIEAVHDWYKYKGREYMKEVAEITYDSGYCRYADIECDSNLTAIYDVIAVIQEIKPASTVIERIERDCYKMSKKGRWIHDGYDHPHGVDWMHCSECGRREPYVPAAMTNYCPTCGAKMEVEHGQINQL